MQVRRKQEPRPFAAITIKSVILGFVVLVVVVYVVSFVTVIGNQNQQIKVDSSLRANANNINWDINNAHHETVDKLAVERLGANEQDHERAPVAVKDHPDDADIIAAAAGAKVVVAKGNEQQKGDDVVTIGFAVSITGCGSDPITEGAAVLKHSVHLASIHGPLNGRYDYKMYAIYHPDAIKCAKTLEGLGYELLERNTPVAVKDIQGEFLRSKIQNNGCCGEKELVKLEAYTLTQHPVIVHMDLDTLILQPLDSLFDWMLVGDKAKSFDSSNIQLQWPKTDKPEKVNAFFTRDYNMSRPHTKHKPVQGGFLVLRPDMNVYNEFVEIIRKGNFEEGGGWGGIGGVFYGSMTFQGIIPYYYDILHPGQAVEANSCVYNQMANNPRSERTIGDIVHGKCMTGEKECEDCRSRPLEEVITSHFTLCQKPWLCMPQDSDVIQQRLCRKLHHEWFRIRSDLEKSWGRPEIGEGTYQPEHFQGYCKTHSQKGYIFIQEPFGVP